MSARGRLVIVTALLLASGCRGDAPVGRLITFDPPPPQDLYDPALPRTDAGTVYVLEVPGLRLEVDPTLKDPITEVGDCTRWISACESPPDRTLDDCVRSAPACTTSTPWLEPATCCPSACATAYASERRKGTRDIDALRAVYFRDASCFPGVRELVGSR